MHFQVFQFDNYRYKKSTFICFLSFQSILKDGINSPIKRYYNMLELFANLTFRRRHHRAQIKHDRLILFHRG